MTRNHDTTDALIEDRLHVWEDRKYATVELDLLHSGYHLTDEGEDAVNSLFEDYHERAADDDAHKDWPVTYGAGTYINFRRLRIPVAHDLADDLADTIREHAQEEDTE